MSTHLIGFAESITSAALINVNAVVDNILTHPQTDRVQVPPDFSSIFFGAALGSTIARAQIVAPSLEVKRASLEVIPLERGADVFTLDSLRIFMPPREILLKPSENLILQCANDAAGADIVQGLISLKAPGPLPEMPPGDIIVAYATSATVLGVNTWTTCPLTLDKELDAGTYALVGFLPISATGIGARAHMVGQNYLPGVPVLPGAANTGRDFDMTTMKTVQFYNMGSFTNIAIPDIQFFASAADTDEYVILYLIKTV